jgi:SAM-dependent methyltransferase
MQNGETDPEVLLQQVRAEVRRRKLALDTSAVRHPESASDSVPERIIAPAQQKGYLPGALLALERARSKQTKVRRWLPIIRRIRRNQGAINDSLIDAVQGHHDTLQLFRGAFWGIDQKLTKIRDFIRIQEKQTAEKHRQLEDLHQQFSEIRSSVREQQQDSIRIESRLNERQEQQRQKLTEIRDSIQAQQKQTAGEQRQLKDSQKLLSEIRASIPPNATLLRERMNALQSSFDLLLDHFAKRKRPLSQSAALSLSEELQNQTTDNFYVAFENQFRGSREMIKERLTFYLPIIQETKARTGDGTALDLGCGRGEWLELLKENAFDGRGVDLNSGMVEECRSRGLEVECVDANAYLRALPSGSLSLITGFHIVEHLPFAALLDLLLQSFRVLRAEGRAIFETPNPECLQVTNYRFFLDPTHRNPIPQELLCFIARYAGFGDARVERLHPYMEEEVPKGYGDYAGIFTK